MNRNLRLLLAGEDWKNTTWTSPSVQFGWTRVHCGLRLHMSQTWCGLLLLSNWTSNQLTVQVNHSQLSLRWFNLTNTHSFTLSFEMIWKKKTLNYKQDPEHIYLTPTSWDDFMAQRVSSRYQWIIISQSVWVKQAICTNTPYLHFNDQYLFYNTYKIMPVTHNRWLLAVNGGEKAVKGQDNHVLWGKVWLSFSNLLPLIHKR